MGLSQREKGKRYEREACKLLRELGYEARRTEQYCGASGDSSDITTNIWGVRFEVKGGYDDVDITSKTVRDWLDKLKGECGDDEQGVALWKRSRRPWLALAYIGGAVMASPDIGIIIQLLENTQ